MASVTANSRMAYAFSRDGALPGSRLWKQVNPRTGTPTNSIWLCTVCSITLALPALFNFTAYLAVTSIAVIGLYISYVAPVFLRLRNPDFQQGPWNLGRWSRPIGWAAVIWVGFIVILFMLPPAYPVTATSFNYAPLAVGAVLLFSGGWWVLSARKWFTGPPFSSDPDEAAKQGVVADPTLGD
jgi:amino acid transporter